MRSRSASRRKKKRKRSVFVVMVLAILAVGAFAYKYISQNRISDPQLVKVTQHANTYKPIPLNTLALWKNEAKSLSSNPDGLDQISTTNSKIHHYENKLWGYSFDFPSDWTIDNHQVPYYTRFFSNNFRVDVTVQDLSKAYTTSDGYIKQTLDSVSSLITSEKKWEQSPFEIQEDDYTRPLIEGIENDMNNYSYFFLTQGNYVYTFQLKATTGEFETRKEDIRQLIKSFQNQKMGNFDLNQKVKQANQLTELSLREQQKTLSIPKNTFMMGIYTPKSYDIDVMEKKLQQPIGAQMFYKPINSTFDAYTQELVHKNRIPMVSFLFQEAYSNDNTKVVQNIINGKYDTTLKDWADHIKGLGAPVLIRPGNEMNGKWSEWSCINNYNDPDLYNLSFIHMVNVFKEAGAYNAYFIWNPNHNSSPYFQWNEAAMYYPGDNVVDIVAMTSYNFGTYKYGQFTDFEKLYDDLYWDYSRSYYKKPLMIGETGSVENGGDKAKWISQMFSDIPTRYPNIKMAIWFDSIHPPFDLRIDTSSQSLDAFAKGMAQPSVVKHLDDTK